MSDYNPLGTVNAYCKLLVEKQDAAILKHFNNELPCRFCKLDYERGELVERNDDGVYSVQQTTQTHMMCDHDKPCVPCSDYKPIEMWRGTR